MITTLRQDKHHARGFTLVEMMVIVIIVGVLATLGSYGVIKYVRTSKTSEAFAMVNEIKAAEEAYRDDTLTYLGTVGAPFASWHPNTSPDQDSMKANWLGGTPNAATQALNELGVMSSGPVYFRYTVVAGDSGAVPNVNTLLSEPIPLPTNSDEPFYLVVARADLDGDGVYQHIVGQSFNSSIVADREGD